MNQEIYNSDTDKALLKSLGPYISESSDTSFKGIQYPNMIVIGEHKLIGDKLIFESNKNKG